MKRLTKKRKEALKLVEADKSYDIKEAIDIVKKATYTKFDASFDIDISLGVDPRKANQMVRGIVTLPHGTGKEKRVLAICSDDKVDVAKAAGADYAGLDEYLDKIKDGWLDFDVVIATPDTMPKLGRFGKILGPRGLMPNPKAGTVTQDIESAIKDVKGGKIDFKVDKYGIVHASIGRASFDVNKVYDNALEIINTIIKLKPAAAKGTYIKNIGLSTSMSIGVKVDLTSISKN